MKHDHAVFSKTIKTLSAGRFVTITKIKPSGSLQVRRQANGAVFFWWRYNLGSVSERVQIGLYDPGAPPLGLTPTKQGGYSLAAAVREAETKAIAHHQHRDQGGHAAIEAANKEAKRRSNELESDARAHTLEKLLLAYCDYLQAIGRPAHRDARSIFALHVIGAWPKTAALPASQVTPEHVADMMRLLLEAGKGRTSNKLRSYIRAAYQVARAARSKPSIPAHFKAFNISSNPAADTEPEESQNKADKNPLSHAELRRYWKIIKPLPGLRGATLRLHILTGGQREEQLVNLLTTNANRDAILIFDGKGRPGRPPRPHVLPLIPAAAAALSDCQPAGTYALSTVEGKTHLAATTLSGWAAKAAEALPDFKTKRIRSGIETLLAAAGVPQEIRGRLQSHGVSGVQARHYDGHDYLHEKRKALGILYKLLQQPEGAKVAPMWNKRS